MEVIYTRNLWFIAWHIKKHVTMLTTNYIAKTIDSGERNR